MAVLSAVPGKLSRMIANSVAFNDAQPFDWEWKDRADQYKINAAFLSNTIYDAQADGGYREIILREIFGIGTESAPDSITRLLPYFNPVRSIVGAYQNIFRGSFGREIKVADTVDDEPVNPALIVNGRNNPIRRLWRWSNLDTEKTALTELAANLGCVGMRIATDAEGTPDAKVSLGIDHPGRIFDFNKNSEGHVTEVELRYIALAGPLGTDRVDVEVREIFTKDEFIREIDGSSDESGGGFRRVNELGVCPYVILRHGEVKREFGRWAYYGAEPLIHVFNWLLSNFGDSIYEHLWPTWFASAGGDKPQIFPVGKLNVAYVKTREGTPPPSLEALVARLDWGGAISFIQELRRSSLVNQCPELLLGLIDALSGQSGETIAKLQTPAEAAIEQAKANYEDALKRALKIGMSEGIRIGLWDLGTGVGSRDAADRAFKSGAEDFEFVDRPALPQTVFDKIQQQTLETAGEKAKVDLAATKAKALPVSDDEILRTAGYDDKQIAKIKAEIANQDILPDDTGGDTVQGGAANA
jgi:hypothetical protein